MLCALSLLYTVHGSYYLALGFPMDYVRIYHFGEPIKRSFLNGFWDTSIQLFNLMLNCVIYYLLITVVVKTVNKIKNRSTK
jgi:hypothetical protein